MKIDINTNGSWRMVLRGLSTMDDKAAEQLNDAKAAAATLARVSAEIDRKPITWRLVSEANDQVIERCGADGWADAYRPEAAA